MGVRERPVEPICQGLGFENKYFTEMCSGSDTGSYLRIIDFVHHSTLSLKVKEKKKKSRVWGSGFRGLELRVRGGRLGTRTAH